MKSHAPITVLAAVAILGTVLPIGLAPAATYTWNGLGPPNNQWNTAGNWTGGWTVGGGAHTYVFANSGSTAVDFDPAAAFLFNVLDFASNSQAYTFTASSTGWLQNNGTGSNAVTSVTQESTSAISLGMPFTINAVGTGVTLRFNGSLLANPGPMTVTGAITHNGAGTSRVELTGPLQVTLNGNNTFNELYVGTSGTVNGCGGRLTGLGQVGGSPFGSAAGAVQVRAAALALQGVAGGSGITKGALTWVEGARLGMDGTAGPATMTFASLAARNGRGTMVIESDSLAAAGNEVLTFSAGMPATVNGILPAYMVREHSTAGGQHVTASGAAVVPYTYTVFAIGTTATDVVDLAGGGASVAGAKAYAIRTNGNITGTDTITLGSGMILNNTLTVDPAVALGNAEGLFYVASGATATMNGITGTGGFTKFGLGELRLAGAIPTGSLYINEGTIRVTTNDSLSNATMVSAYSTTTGLVDLGTTTQNINSGQIMGVNTRVVNGSIVVNPGGILRVGGTASGQIDSPITLAGGGIHGQSGGSGLNGRFFTVNGQVTLTADSFLYGTTNGNGGAYADNVVFNGKITESGGPQKLTVDNMGRVDFYSAANDFSGGLWIRSGTVGAYTGSGALGVGDVVIGQASGVYQPFYNSGSYTFRAGALYTQANGVMDANLAGGNRVEVRHNGFIQFQTTELAAAGHGTVDLYYGGCINRSAGSTVFNYDPAAGASQTISLKESGVILGSGLPTLPSYAIVSALPPAADGVFGLYRGNNVDTAVGDDGGANIWRGIGSLGNSTLTFSKIVSQAVAGADAWFYAQGSPGNGGIVYAAGTAVNTPTMYLDGWGTHTFNSASGIAGTFTDVYKKGPGELAVTVSGAMGSGKTIHVQQGYMRAATATALTGLTVTLDSGTLFRPNDSWDSSGNYYLLTAGSVTANAGAAVVFNAADKYSSTYYTLNAGAQIVMTGTPGASTTALPTNVDVVLANTVNLANPITLSDATRLTMPVDYLGNARSITVGASSSIDLAAGSATGRLSAPTGSTLTVSSKINFPYVSGNTTLVVGDMNLFQVVRAYNTSQIGPLGMDSVAQDGTVVLSNANNDFDAVEIQKGTLRIDTSVARLGGASDILLLGGGTLWLNYSPASWTGALHGTGTVQVGPSGTGTLTLGTGSTVGPGSSAGLMDITGDLAFAAGTETLTLEVVGGSLTPGVGFDQLAVSGTLSGIDNVDLVIDIQGVAGFGPSDILYLVTTRSDLTGLNFRSVTVNGGTIDQVVIGDGFVALTNVPEPATLGLLGLGFLPLLVRRRRK